jgi:hypothetical protein
MHVEKSFDRNLGDLIHARYGIPGRLMERTTDEAVEQRGLALGGDGGGKDVA